MNNCENCIEGRPRIGRLAGVTRTMRLAIFEGEGVPTGTPQDLTAKTVVVRVLLDGTNDIYVPDFVVEGTGNNVIKFVWPANRQAVGNYTLDVTMTDGGNNVNRVNWHGKDGIRLVQYSNQVYGEDATGQESSEAVGLVGYFTTNGVGMSAFDEWRGSEYSEGYPQTVAGFMAYLRQPATDAANAARQQMQQIQSRADEDHTRAGNDHSTAESDHTRAEGDHTTAASDHTTAAADHTAAAADHTQAGNDHTRAEGDHTTAASDHTQAAADHTQAASDHSTAAEDHTQAVADHAVMAGYDTRLTNVETDVTQLGQKVVEKAPGKNLYDGVLESGYFKSDGTIDASSANSHTKNYIPVEPETQYHISRNNDGVVAIGAAVYICFYNEQKQFLSSQTFTADGIKNITTPVNCYFLRTTIRNSYDDEVQIELGSTRTAFEPYTPIMGYLNYLPNSCVENRNIIPQAVSFEKIKEVYVSESNSRNIFNLIDVLENGGVGKYFKADGSIGALNGHAITPNYFRVKPSTQYYLTAIHPTAGTEVSLTVSANCRIVYYDAALNILENGVVGLNALKTFTTPADAVYARVCTTTDRTNAEYKPQLNEGSSRGVYEEYNPIYGYLKAERQQIANLDSQVLKTTSLLGKERNYASAESLAANASISLTNFPKYSHKQTGVTAKAEFSSFTDFYLGNEYSGGLMIKIGTTNVEFLLNYGTGSQSAWETVAHGLTFDTFIKVTVYQTKYCNPRLVLFTKGGMKIIDSEVAYSFNGTWTCHSSGAITNVELSATCGAFRCPIWAFGDSYFGVSEPRVGGQLMNIGFFNLYWSYLSGGHGYDLEPDFALALNFGTPKFAVWAIGQNDADSDSAISSTWKTNTEAFIALCEAKGIIPILCTIPNVPGSGTVRNHSFKNAYVKTSGYRYIDTEAAVGAQSDGTWYPDMLSSDNVHPSVLGAKAIAMQWLVDFPEIMEFGLLDEKLSTE